MFVVSIIFFIDDEDLGYVDDLCINSHAIKYKETGGRTIYGMLRHDVPFIKTFQPDHIILMVGGNGVRRLYSPQELACKLLGVVSLLHKSCSVSQIQLYVNYFQDLGSHSIIINLSMQPTLLSRRT